MDHSAPGGHPQHIAGPQHSFIAIACLALNGEGHNLESSVWVWPTCAAAWRKIDPVVRQNDERIVVRKLARVDHMNCCMTLADESWSCRRERHRFRESTCFRGWTPFCIAV
jgi:hypothetical protein